MGNEERGKNNGCRQSNLTDYLNGNKPRVRENSEKRHMNSLAKRHLEEFFRIKLEHMTKNSVELERVLAHIYIVLRGLEEKGVCYLKTMANGKTRIFKQYYCQKGLEDWKKCKRYKCPALYTGMCPDNELSEMI